MLLPVGVSRFDGRARPGVPVRPDGPAGQPEELGEGEAVAEGDGEPVGSAPSRLAISCCASCGRGLGGRDLGLILGEVTRAERGVGRRRSAGPPGRAGPGSVPRPNPAAAAGRRPSGGTTSERIGQGARAARTRSRSPNRSPPRTRLSSGISVLLIGLDVDGLDVQQRVLERDHEGSPRTRSPIRSWPSSVRSEEKRASWLIREKTLASARRRSPPTGTRSSRCRRSPARGPDLAASQATMFCRSSGVEGQGSARTSRPPRPAIASGRSTAASGRGPPVDTVGSIGSAQKSCLP